MRLLKTTEPGENGNFELAEFIGSNIPEYAILSHTWGEGEVLFEDVMDGTAPSKPAYLKVLAAICQARRDNFAYLWIDTCCIDKRSSAELQEAINSMYTWYKRAEVCYAYLSDVKPTYNLRSGDNGLFDDEFRTSRWFTRGWTLQELIAPQAVAFFTQNWTYIGRLQKTFRSPGSSRKEQYKTYRSSVQPVYALHTMELLVAGTSGISASYLTEQQLPAYASVATKMHWASKRETTREEDRAYSLLGLFDVNMPLLYGEGSKAFLRPQEEIMKQADDTSLFAWNMGAGYIMHTGY